MKIVVKKPKEKGTIIEGENKLETYQNIVGGYIETYSLVNDILIVLNEEGILEGLEHNMLIRPHMNEYKDTALIVGTVAFVSEDNGDFKELNEGQLETLRQFNFI